MNQLDENQHSISQVLLERFKIPGSPLHCYQVQTGEWISKSKEKACAWPGYNQLLVSGVADNTLEEAFSQSGIRSTEDIQSVRGCGEETINPIAASHL